MALKPWHTLMTPREDLREGKPLDASEFAVHLEQVRDGRARSVYQKPEEFFDRTYLTQNLTALAAEVIRRLSSEITETSAVFNMTTQFGGGKTHSLTLLWHLAKNGPAANGWRGVNKLLERAGIAGVPQAEVAVFVGTEFDSLTGRKGEDGEPTRKTPWGEIAFQIGGTEAYAVVSQHDEQMIAPAGDVIRQFLPKEKPCLILIDELMNYVSSGRKLGAGTQFYNFLQNLAEEIRARNNAVLVVALPASMQNEMSVEDQSDYSRFQHLLNRLGKPLMMSSETEYAEIIRRRLFEWDAQKMSLDGKVLLEREAMQTCNTMASWVTEQRNQLPTWFPVDNARAKFEAAYPFHPVVLDVFDRKWKSLPRFQQTRGILRLLALWVSHAYQDGFQNNRKDPLIGLGSAPLDNPFFRSATFEQLGNNGLEAAVTTDICGKPDAFAIRLDQEAMDTIKKSRLHRKVATAIFFESNGGTTRNEATVPELRLAVGEPAIDIGNIETVLETLSSSCYFLSVERNKYKFSLSPNLNKMLADRRATIKPKEISECVRAEVQSIFKNGAAVEKVLFPEKSNQISDQPALTLVILPPEQSFDDKDRTLAMIEAMTRECGQSGRTFKSALIWVVPESPTALAEDARKLLAWEGIDDEAKSIDLRLDEGQRRQLTENLGKAQRDLKETARRTYRHLVFLGRDGNLREVDLGLFNSSAGEMTTIILGRLRQDDEYVAAPSPNVLTRNWPAFKEWSTKAARDAFFASPKLPRVPNSEAIKDVISRGVSSGIIAYVGKLPNGEYQPFVFGTTLPASDVEISDEVFIITKETAEAYQRAKAATAQNIESADTGEPLSQSRNTDSQKLTTPKDRTASTQPEPPPVTSTVTKLAWLGDIPPQKWTTFYTKVLTKFATGKGLTLTLSLNVSSEDGISAQKIEETKAALLELGLNDKIDTE